MKRSFFSAVYLSLLQTKTTGRHGGDEKPSTDKIVRVQNWTHTMGPILFSALSVCEKANLRLAFTLILSGQLYAEANKFP